MSELSVVVATRNRETLLRKLLDALAAQSDQDFELVVVDDGSTDGTAALLEAHGAARVLRHERPRGPATARDEGWRSAGGSLIAFTDDDCVPSPGWVAALKRAVHADPGAAVMGRTLPDPGARRSPFTRTVLIERAGPPYETCNILYPRELLERIGGFDRSFPAPVGEDTDLGWRAARAGARFAYAPEALVHHAVHDLGPLGALRAVLRFHEAGRLFRLHPDLRREQLHRGFFWAPAHEHLLRALLAALLPRRLWPLSAWLAFPYARRLVWRRSGPLLAPYILLQDLVEMYAIARGAVRERVPML